MLGMPQSRIELGSLVPNADIIYYILRANHFFYCNEIGSNLGVEQKSKAILIS
jgi:hypothetical protein